MFSSNQWGPQPVPQQGASFQDPYRALLGALQQFQAQRYEIIRVNGENGAQAFQMAPNSSALLLDGITNGLCDGFYAQNTTMLNGFAGITTAVREAQFASQQCCCETNRNIDSVRYDAQKNTCDIISAIHAEGEATRSLIQANEVQALRDKVKNLELRDAMCGVVRYPNSWAYNAGTSPFCGCNSGCCNI